MSSTPPTGLASAALDRSKEARRLSRDQILALYELPAETLAAAAHEARLRQTDPDTVTYDLGGNIDYTNVCTVACKFCTFYRTSRQPGAFTLTLEDIRSQMALFATVGVLEIQMQGGVNPELPFDWYLELLRSLKAEYPAIHLNAFSPEEILGLERLVRRPALGILSELREAGLDGLPGAAAEILVDDVRRRTAPARIPTGDWLRIVDAALEAGLYVPWVSMVTGFGETRSQRVEHLMALRDGQDRALERHGRGYAAFKVWPARLDDTRLKDMAPVRLPEHVAQAYLREVAIARLALENVPHHRAVWRTMGFEVASAALRSGADDVCGTGSINAIDSILEKAGRPITDAADVILSRVERCIGDAGFRPAARDPRYRVLAAIRSS
jgi:cyclic dehypoxanthinyl futalosine synthase